MCPETAGFVACYIWCKQNRLQPISFFHRIFFLLQKKTEILSATQRNDTQDVTEHGRYPRNVIRKIARLLWSRRSETQILNSDPGTVDPWAQQKRWVESLVEHVHIWSFFCQPFVIVCVCLPFETLLSWVILARILGKALNFQRLYFLLLVVGVLVMNLE